MGRLDQITVRLSTDEVTLPWTTREQLLTKLGQHPLGEHDLDRAIRKAFDDVGASSPVTLTLDQKTHLLRLLEQSSAARGHRRSSSSSTTRATAPTTPA